MHDDYVHDEFAKIKKRRPRRTGGRSVVLMVIFINFALWIANGLLSTEDHPQWLTQLLWLQSESFWHIASCYRFLTYGFVHDYNGLAHIAFNMLGLLMFGYGMMLGIGSNGFGFVRSDNVENSLGRREFIAFYLLTICIGGIVFALTNPTVPQANEIPTDVLIDAPRAICLGASGGVAGVIIMYAWLFPRKTLFLYGILPLPMWALGVFIVFMDATGAAGRPEDGIAYSVHLAGAAFGTLYYLLLFRQGLTLTGWLDKTWTHSNRKSKLRAHIPADTTLKSSIQEDDFSRRLDDILKRYGEVGESGLTTEERAFLRRASKRFAEKHHKQ